MLVLFVSVMHVFWGVMLLLNGGAIGTTATSVFRQLVPNYGLRALIYLVAGLLPSVLIKWPGSLAGLFSCLPQQILLIFSAISATVAITSGHYADGTVRGWIFIAADQAIYILLAVLYSAEALDRYHER